jgi:hypothetical protein
MEAWPDEELEARSVSIATAAAELLLDPAAWRHRRVETLTVLSHEQIRRAVSVDFTVPVEWRDLLQLSPAGEYVVPLALLVKRPLVHFDLRNEEGHSVPMLTAAQNAMIDYELLVAALEFDLEHLEVDEATVTAVMGAASPVIETVVGGGSSAGTADRIERDVGLPLGRFSDLVAALGKGFIVWAVVRDIDRRRVLKFAYDEPFAQLPKFRYVYDAEGCAEAASYHAEVVVPPELKARTTILREFATEVELARGPEDTDRPAVYFSVDPRNEPAQPVLAVAYGAERGRFLVPAAIVATVITLLVALPRLFADLEALAGSAGPAIGLVLSTSAVFSALVLRTDEHPLVRLMLVRYRLCLVASTLAALFATAVLGFQADAWLLNAGWTVSAVVSAAAAGILIFVAARSPSARGSYSRPGAQP